LFILLILSKLFSSVFSAHCSLPTAHCRYNGRMSTPISLADLPFEAAAFAARAHQHHKRKDGQTPYVSHVFRVCLVVRHTFGFDDPRMLAAALLHDTIEDTTTDCDDLIERFGEEVAEWVAELSKDSRLPYDAREEEYAETLAEADWQVKALKLADLYDNLGDMRHFAPAPRRRFARKARLYLNAVRTNLPDHVQPALRLVEERLTEFENGLTS
jgi:guanosine-3',5'-bis(diphosphate) 3'-pyrophosphohydrolase